MLLDPFSIAVAVTGVFMVAFMKGAFGGGMAIIGIPLLALAMDPLTAGALLAPLFIAMDLVALRYWKPSTWSKPDLIVLLPCLIAGIGLGFALLHLVDGDAVAIAIGIVSIGFAALWFAGGGQVTVQPRSTPKAMAAGLGSGITTMIAHSGGPPLAIYLLPLGMAKDVYAGTTSLFFTVGNIVKAGPWLMLASPTASLWTLMVICLPVVPLGVWAGWMLHQRLDQLALYRICYGLLIVTGLKLLWDGLSGHP